MITGHPACDPDRFPIECCRWLENVTTADFITLCPWRQDTVGMRNTPGLMDGCYDGSRSCLVERKLWDDLTDDSRIRKNVHKPDKSLLHLSEGKWAKNKLEVKNEAPVNIIQSKSTTELLQAPPCFRIVRIIHITTLRGRWVQMSPPENSEEAKGSHAERENSICCPRSPDDDA